MRVATTLVLLLVAVLAFTGPAAAEREDKPKPIPTGTIELAEAWVKSFIVKNAPPGRKIWLPGAQETVEEGEVRYADIAKDVVWRAYHPDTVSLFKSTKSGRSRTLAVWLGIMLHESGFTKNVDKNIGKYARGDQGRSWCMMQLQIGKGRTLKWNFAKNRRVRWGDKPEDIFHGYKGDEIIADRRKCLGEGHKMVRISFKACRTKPLEHRLTSYAAGFCNLPEDADEEKKARYEDGKKKSASRMRTGIRWFRATGPGRGFRDEHVVKEIAALVAIQNAAKKKKALPDEAESTPVSKPLAANQPR